MTRASPIATLVLAVLSISSGIAVSDQTAGTWGVVPSWKESLKSLRQVARSAWAQILASAMVRSGQLGAASQVSEERQGIWTDKQPGIVFICIDIAATSRAPPDMRQCGLLVKTPAPSETPPTAQLQARFRVTSASQMCEIAPNVVDMHV